MRQLSGRTVITARDEMLSLTDMWRASGKAEEKRPSDWLESRSVKEFIAHVEASYNAGNSGIIQAERGRAGSTFAHWQIGLAYAKYLSPEFHMWCNEVVRELVARRRRRKDRG